MISAPSATPAAGTDRRLRPIAAALPWRFQDHPGEAERAAHRREIARRPPAAALREGTGRAPISQSHPSLSHSEALRRSRATGLRLQVDKRAARDGRPAPESHVDMGAELALHAVARGTSLGYATGLRSLESFARVADPHAAVPFSPATVAAWIGFCASEGLLWTTVKKYMAGIGEAHRDARLANPCDDRAVKKTFKGLRNVQGGYGSTRRRFCVTLKMLDGIYDDRANISTHLKRLLKALAFLGFYGLLRNSELLDGGPLIEHVVVVSGQGERPLQDLITAGDLVLRAAFTDCTCLKLFLGSSKTDREKKGVWAVVHKKAAPVLLELILRHPRKAALGRAGAPLLSDERDRPLTSATAIPAWTSILLANGHITSRDELEGVGISFRSGGATRLFELGTEDSIIRMLGRWKSDCFLRYLRETTTSLTALTVLM